MAALPSLSAVGTPVAGDLRDPTLEELFTAPARALPDEIQQLPAEDTACTFCGVSYFVFAEVQTLQNTVKQYKKTFRQFVQFLERERQEAKALRQNVTELQDTFSQLVARCSATTKQLAEQSQELRKANNEALAQLQKVQRELLETQSASRELQLLSKRNEDELKMSGLLTEQKLRNEILHLSSQVESCKLMSESQQAAFTAEQGRDRQTIQGLEAKLAESQAHWTAAERLLVNERDNLKQKLLNTTERVDLEVSISQKLQTELTAIREELTRVVNASEAEHKLNSQMNSEIIQLKHQLQGLEKSKVQLLSENGRLKEGRDKNQDELAAIRLRADHLQGQLAVSSSSLEKVKNDYACELEKLRGDHGMEISRLQRDHTRSIEDLKTNQSNYIEYLKKETVELQSRGEMSSQQAILAMQEKLQDAERRASEWRDRALQNANEREDAKRATMRFESIVQDMKSKLDASERNKQTMQDEADVARLKFEKEVSKARQEANGARQDVARKQEELQLLNASLEKRLETLQAQLDEAKQRAASGKSAASRPQLAWQSKAHGGKNHHDEDSSNQDSHHNDNEKLIEQLQLTVKQKDREIALLQQTVHRECLERTSLLDRLRSGKLLPEVCALRSSAVAPEELTNNDRESLTQSSSCDNGHDGDIAPEERPKASFYEKLRRTGSRKPKPRGC